MYCIVLYCIVLYYIILYYIIIVLYRMNLRSQFPDALWILVLQKQILDLMTIAVLWKGVISLWENERCVVLFMYLDNLSAFDVMTPGSFRWALCRPWPSARQKRVCLRVHEQQPTTETALVLYLLIEPWNHFATSFTLSSSLSFLHFSLPPASLNFSSFLISCFLNSTKLTSQN